MIHPECAKWGGFECLNGDSPVGHTLLMREVILAPSGRFSKTFDASPAAHSFSVLTGLGRGPLVRRASTMFLMSALAKIKQVEMKAQNIADHQIGMGSLY